MPFTARYVSLLFVPAQQEHIPPSGWNAMGKILTTNSDIIKIIFAIILPPLGVFLERGCNADFLINILLTVLGYIPVRSLAPTFPLFPPVPPPATCQTKLQYMVLTTCLSNRVSFTPSTLYSNSSRGDASHRIAPLHATPHTPSNHHPVGGCFSIASS